MPKEMADLKINDIVTDGTDFAIVKSEWGMTYYANRERESLTAEEIANAILVEDIDVDYL